MSYWNGTRWVEEDATPAPRPPSRSASWISTLLMVVGLAALVAPMNFIAAASHNRTTPSSIWLMAPSAAAAPAAWPALGSSVNFGATYPKATKNAWVSLRCYQGEALVYGEGGSPNDTFTLGGASSEWVASPGPAFCTAELGDLYWRGAHEYYTYLAETSFDAS